MIKLFAVSAESFCDRTTFARSSGWPQSVSRASCVVRYTHVGLQTASNTAVHSYRTEQQQQQPAAHCCVLAPLKNGFPAVFACMYCCIILCRSSYAVSVIDGRAVVLLHILTGWNKRLVCRVFCCYVLLSYIGW